MFLCTRNCKSKIRSIYIFIFCHLDICTGLGSVKKGVPCEYLSYCLKVLHSSVRLTGVWGRCGAPALQGWEPRSWQGNGLGCSCCRALTHPASPGQCFGACQLPGAVSPACTSGCTCRFSCAGPGWDVAGFCSCAQQTRGLLSPWDLLLLVEHPCNSSLA